MKYFEYMLKKCMDDYPNSDPEDNSPLEFSVSNIQTGRAYAFAVPLIFAMVSPLPLAAGIFNLYIDLFIILFSWLFIVHTCFTYRYSDFSFYITDIRIKQKHILSLKKDWNGITDASVYNLGAFLREYDISNLSSIECTVTYISKLESFKRPLLLLNEKLKLTLNINQIDKSEQYIIFFKPNQDSYKKICQIINLLNKLEMFSYKFDNIDKNLFAINEELY